MGRVNERMVLAVCTLLTPLEKHCFLKGVFMYINKSCVFNLGLFLLLPGGLIRNYVFFPVCPRSRDSQTGYHMVAFAVPRKGGRDLGSFFLRALFLRGLLSESNKRGSSLALQGGLGSFSCSEEDGDSHKRQM